jgi:membrane protein
MVETPNPKTEPKKDQNLWELTKRLWDPISLRNWAKPYRDKRGWRAFAVNQTHIFILTLRSIYREEITIRAAALTYNTVLSLVPLLAVGFALFKAFGGLQRLEAPLKAVIIENLAVGRAAEIGGWLDRFIGNINAGAIAGIGVLVLFYSAIGLLTNIEGSINRIWGIKKGRSFITRFFMYWGLITLTPPLMALSVSLTGRLQSSAFTQMILGWLPWGLGKVVIGIFAIGSTAIAFAVAYQIVPNTKVRFKAALHGGIVAGILWNLTKVLFFAVSANTLKYSAIYGALGVMPLLMIWLYLSWLIVLLGATYAYAIQSVSTEDLEFSDLELNQAFRELLGARLVLCAARAFDRGESAPTLHQISDHIGVTSSLARHELDVLTQHGILTETEIDDQVAYLPGRSLRGLSLAAIVDVLRNKEGRRLSLKEDDDHHRIYELLERADHFSAETLGEANIQTLVETEPSVEG